MSASIWDSCLPRLERELSAQDFNTWIRPLQVVEENGVVYLLAPNRFVVTWIKENFWNKILELARSVTGSSKPEIRLQVGSRKHLPKEAATGTGRQLISTPPLQHGSPLNPKFTFHTFVPGGSNQLAREASLQVAQHGGFSPLFIYGGVGLGKTHLMQAVGNMMEQVKPQAKVVYLHTERFVANMVKALQNKSINEFKKFYRTADVLLMDDVQFLSGKTQSQEEFLHTFNTLEEKQRQLVFTCDRMPRELGVEERLRSRLGSGLTARIDKPELETRVEILQSKANQAHTRLSDEVALFIAQHIDSSIRELEGALHRVIASARFMQREITLDFSQEALTDLLAVRNKNVTVEDIQLAVSEYFQISLEELNSKRRHRHLVRPRQIAISLSKELTSLSLPEIGSAFGGRDRTTVVHSCKALATLKEKDNQIREDYLKLLKILSE